MTLEYCRALVRRYRRALHAPFREALTFSQDPKSGLLRGYDDSALSRSAGLYLWVQRTTELQAPRGYRGVAPQACQACSLVGTT